MGPLLLAFLLIPLIELYVIIQVGGWIGTVPTIGLLLLTGLVGAPLAASQGRAAWARFGQALGEGRMPGREIFDGAMIILAGAMLITPGFLTDIAGLFLLLPPTRSLLRSGLARRVAVATPGAPVFIWASRRAGGPGGRVYQPGGGPEPGPKPARRDYDVEGTAHEVTDEGLAERAGSGAEERDGHG